MRLLYVYYKFIWFKVIEALIAVNAVKSKESWQIDCATLQALPALKFIASSPNYANEVQVIVS